MSTEINDKLEEILARAEKDEWMVEMGPHCFVHLLDGSNKLLSDDFHDYEPANKVADAHNRSTVRADVPALVKALRRATASMWICTHHETALIDIATILNAAPAPGGNKR